MAYAEAVSRYLEVPIPFNYPVVGHDAFETSTGVHAAAVIKALRRNDPWLANRVYSGVPAEDYGRRQTVTIGPMSGKSNVIWWLEQNGFVPEERLVDRIFEAAKRNDRVLSDEAIREICASAAAHA
jgi:2-isopropylmalate synthase